MCGLGCSYYLGGKLTGIGQGKTLKFISKIGGLNFEIVAVQLLDHVSDFSHSDSISKLCNRT